MISAYILPFLTLQAVKEKHTRADCFLLYNVLYDGVVECSNTLEDAENMALPSQASVFQPLRERLYGLLMLQPTLTGTLLSVHYYIAFS